jgi:hypothetical protein
MRTQVRGWVIFSAATLASVVCAAQAAPNQFDEEHARGVAANPPGVALKITTANGRYEFRPDEPIHFKLSFTNTSRHSYTAELDSGGNAASARDVLVIQSPDPAAKMFRSSNANGFGCCSGKRRSLGRTPIVGTLSIRSIKALVNSPPNVPIGALDWFSLPPGNYAIFVQTRRVMRGWPSLADQYQTVSDLVVTSSNVLHIKLLPEGGRP